MEGHLMSIQKTVGRLDTLSHPGAMRKSCFDWSLGFPSDIVSMRISWRYHSTWAPSSMIFSIFSTLMEFTLGAPNHLLEKLMVTFGKRHLIQIRSQVNLHRSVVMYHRQIQGEVIWSRIRCLSHVGISVLRRLRFLATVLSWTVGSIILLSNIGGHDWFHHCSWCSLQSTCCTCTGAGAGNLGGVAI